MPQLISSAIRRLRKLWTSARAYFEFLVRSIEVGANHGVIAQDFAIDGGRVRVWYRYSSKGDKGVIEQIFADREYNVERWRQGKALRCFYVSSTAAGKTPLIIDAGANIGVSCAYFLHAYPLSHVVAVEPERNNCELLRLNCRGKSVDIIEGALGLWSEPMYVSDPGLSDWGFRIEKSGDYPVQVIAPDTLVALYGDARFQPFLFKADIEGSEAQLFDGAIEWLDGFALVVLELHDWMLPGRRISRGFLQAITKFDFDVLHNGENVFCFNNRLLRAYYREH